jgi:hypothetical protein
MGLAVITPIGRVRDIIGIVNFTGLDDLKIP